MSPTPIPSETAKTARKAWAPRWLVILHRYLGIAVGLLMLLWFASGVVMLFVHWPEVTEEERIAGLPAIDWRGCCAFGDIPDVREVRRAAVEDLAGRAVLRLGGETIDLATGRPIAAVHAGEARAVAEAFARQTGIAGSPRAITAVERDQWTVTGYFDRQRPFWRVRLSDPAASDLYVSARDGRIVQATDAWGRALNWLGPIPHWLYPRMLRQNTKLWTQVVIWSSLVGVFLTLTGLYLGVVAWRPWRDARLTPFRGLMAWHHLTGLAAGLLTLTWVLSGLFSMNPWGFLRSGPDTGRERLAGAVAFADLRTAVAAAGERDVPAGQLRLAPLEGRLRLMADGARLDGQARPAPLAQAELAAAARALGPVARQGLIRAEDAYYFGHHAPVRLPAWRVILKDGTRYYLDPGSGEVLARADRPAQGYRWLHLGLHRLDVLRGLDRGPAWAAAMTALLLLAGSGVGTGVWLAWRRVKADMARLART